MLNKETLKLGESFERLLVNTDYLALRKYIEEQLQLLSDQLLQPKVPISIGISNAPAPISMEEIALNTTYVQGQLIGLAMPESHMEDVIKQMNKLKEEKEKKLG